MVAVINGINEMITNAPEKPSVREQRYILLNFNNRWILPYYRMENKKNPPWLERIINALVEKGHLFKLDEKKGLNYFIQA